jgi:putative two-component system response regulator
MHFIDRTLIRNSIILAVDDSPVLLDALDISVGELCKEFIVANDTEQAIKLIVDKKPNLVLLDIEMPGMNGFDFFEKLKEMTAIARIPVIFLTSSDDKKMEAKALEIGAVDYLTKPFDRTVLLHRINTHLNISYHCTNLENALQTIESELVSVFSTLLESRDKNTNGHAIRTSHYLKILGEKMISLGTFAYELNESVLQRIVRAAPLHDIGKIGVPDSVLLKPEDLTKDEFEVMKTHTSNGAAVLDSLYKRMPSQYYLLFAEQMALSHHEHFNGKGYPNKLSGNEIPLCARMMAIADVYDALTKNRVYRKAMSHEKACETILNENGTHFDPVLVDVFMEVRDEFREVAENRKQVS